MSVFFTFKAVRYFRISRLALSSFVEIAWANFACQFAKFCLVWPRNYPIRFSEFAGFVAFVAATLHKPPFDSMAITGAAACCVLLAAVSAGYLSYWCMYNSDIGPGMERHSGTQVEKHTQILNRQSYNPLTLAHAETPPRYSWELYLFSSWTRRSLGSRRVRWLKSDCFAGGSRVESSRVDRCDSGLKRGSARLKAAGWKRALIEAQWAKSGR